MAKNDLILLDGIIDDLVSKKIPSAKRDEAFEYFTIQQILKEHELSKEEIGYGLIDGRGDGGIDGFYIFINGLLLQDSESFNWPRSGAELKIVIVSCKHHDTFKQATLDAMIATLIEVFNFSIDENKLNGKYSESIKLKRRNLMYAYRKLSPCLSEMSVEAYYSSRGDVEMLGDEVGSRGEQIKKIAQDSFGKCKASFGFIGCTELIQMHRKIPNYTLELPFVDSLSKGERYVVLARLIDYYKFVTENGKLRRHLFESNVRSFMGMNRVNEDIKETLEDLTSPDFWLLNNGITILANSAQIIGGCIQASDIQIVNGLQTTESIFRHYQSGGRIDDERSVLIKVIVLKDEKTRDLIIRATNNQTDVELSSLHATDKIQRDIEDILLRHGIYYERRKNYYSNIGHNPADIVSPLYLASGYIALVLKLTHRSIVLRSRFMRSTDSYEKVFSNSASIELWPAISKIMKRIDFVLEHLRPKNTGSEKFLKTWRYVVGLLSISKYYGTYAYSSNDLIKFDANKISVESIRLIIKDLQDPEMNVNYFKKWSNQANVINSLKIMATKYGISNIEAIQKNKNKISDQNPKKKINSNEITPELIELVRTKLPAQPWKPGMHKSLIKEIKCSYNQFFGAVEKLREDGIVYHQKDGVLFDFEGNVISFDTDRVHPETLQLINEETV
jgi:hypothetical protein